jgi:hypothetical protein
MMKKSRIPRRGAIVFCKLCGASPGRLPDGSIGPHVCHPEIERFHREPCGHPAPCPCEKLVVGARRDESVERAKRFFADWAPGSRVMTEFDIIYVCDEVDGRLPAGSLGTVIRRAMVGLYVIRWDVMPGHELRTSADSLYPAPSAAHPIEPSPFDRDNTIGPGQSADLVFQEGAFHVVPKTKGES